MIGVLQLKRQGKALQYFIIGLPLCLSRSFLSFNVSSQGRSRSAEVYCQVELLLPVHRRTSITKYIHNGKFGLNFLGKVGSIL